MMSLTQATLLASFVLIAHLILRTIYRLSFHPLSKFPGPKLTASTYLVEHYYELFHGPGGQFSTQYRQWHDHYGPIIRINPDELHIRDSSFYETLYSPTRPVRKVKNFGYRFNNEHTSFGAEDPGLWKERRRVLDPFFSRRKIAGYVPGMQAKTSKLLDRLREEYVGSGEVLSVTKMWECFAADNVVSFAVDRQYDFLASPGFVSGVNEAVTNMTGLTHWMSFDFVAVAVRSLPVGVVVRLVPGLKPVFEFWEEQENQIKGVLDSHAKGEKLGDTLFSSLLENGVGEREQHLIFERLQSEAKAVVGAGSETTARSLSVATFHIIDQPEVHQRLREELTQAIPDATTMPDWKSLSQLPYLSACVEEALRLSYGLSERRARAYDGGVLLYHDGTQERAIPPGTFVSMDHYDVSHDETIFPDSSSYIPERWLDNPTAPDGKALNRYMVTFGKGARSCVGMQLAYAQLYVGLANFFRWEMSGKAELYESSKADLEMAMCCFVPRPRLGGQGVRVLLHG